MREGDPVSMPLNCGDLECRTHIACSSEPARLSQREAGKENEAEQVFLFDSSPGLNLLLLASLLVRSFPGSLRGRKRGSGPHPFWKRANYAMLVAKN